MGGGFFFERLETLTNIICRVTAAFELESRAFGTVLIHAMTISDFVKKVNIFAFQHECRSD